MRKINLFALFAFCLISNLSVADVVTSASSPASPQCIKRIRRCLEQKDLDRANCLYESSTESVCEESALSTIILRRWSLAPVPPSVNRGAAALTGSNMIDQACIDSFDSLLQEKLSNTKLNDEALTDLTIKLDQCQEGNSLEMLRP